MWGMSKKREILDGDKEMSAKIPILHWKMLFSKFGVLTLNDINDMFFITSCASQSDADIQNLQLIFYKHLDQ